MTSSTTSASTHGTETLVLSNRARNTLRRGGLTTVEAIDATSDSDLLAIRACGFGQLEEIREAVARFHEHGPAAPRPMTLTDPALADIDVRTMGLRPRTLRILLSADLVTIDSVDATSRSDLMALPGFGVNSLNDWLRCRADMAKTVASGAYVPAEVTDLGDLSSVRRQRVDLADTELRSHASQSLADLDIHTVLDLTSFDADTFAGLVDADVLAEVEAVMRLHNLTFRDACSKDSFAEPYALLLDYADEHGHAAVPRDHVTDEDYRLGQWVAWMRQSHKAGDVDAARRRALTSVPGWAWSTRSASQAKAHAEHQATLNALKAFVAEHGHPFPSPVVENEKHLSVALRTLRADRLRVAEDVAAQFESIEDWTWSTAEARQRLDDMGLTWQRVQSEQAFEEGITHLRAYAEVHGHSCPRHYYVSEDGFALGMWVIRTRRRRTSLTEEQTAALEALDGWYWDGTLFYAEQRWRASYDRAESYIDFHGKDAYVRTATDGNFRVGAWLHSQCVTRDELSPERREMLERLPHWEWRTAFKQATSPGRIARAQRAWEENLAALRGFLAAHHRLPTTAETHHGRNIGQWCVARRFEYRHGNLAPERIADLEAVDGWKWVVPMGRTAHVATQAAQTGEITDHTTQTASQSPDRSTDLVGVAS